MINVRKKHPEIPLEQYPTTLLVVSDMQFNPTTYNWETGMSEETNFEYSKNKLKEVFPSDFVDNMKFVWWDVASRYGNTDFEGDAMTSGCYFFSGFDGSILSMLMNDDSVKDTSTNKVRKITAEELVVKALNQEILTYINI